MQQMRQLAQQLRTHLHLVEKVKQETLRVLLDSHVDCVAIEVLHGPEKWEGVDRLQKTKMPDVERQS